METSTDEHGFSTREAWTKWFTNYNIIISDLRNEVYELIQTDIPDDEWIKKYKNNSIRVRAVYHKNEEMLDWHIRWFTRSKDRWTQNVADPLISTLFRYVTRIQDLGTAYEIADSLIKFYEPLNNMPALMKCYTIRAFASGFLDIVNLSDKIHENCISARKIYELYFDVLTPEEHSMGLSIFDMEINRMVNQLKFKDITSSALDDIIDWYHAANRYKKEVLLEDQGYDFNFLLPDFDYYLGVTSLFIKSNICTPQQIETICNATHRLYSNCLKSPTVKENYLMRNKLVYLMSSCLKGLHLEKQVLEEIREFIEKHSKDFMIKNTYSIYSAEIAEAVHLIGENLLKNNKQDQKLYREIQDFFITFSATRPYSTYMDYICAYHNYGYIITTLPYFNSRQRLLGDLLKLTVFRQVQTAMHSIMVGNLSIKILNSLIDNEPETLIGQFNAKTVKDVLKLKSELSQYLYHGALLHDIGKLLCSCVVNAQSHSLTDFEFQVLKFHPVSAGAMLERIPNLAIFKDIALGHHKSFDGKSGYPSNFDNTASPRKIFIDIITICDSLDAATDHLGRNYTREKSFTTVLEELRNGSGTRYSNILVDLLHTDEQLQQDIRFLLKDGRRQVYCDVHKLILSQLSNVSCIAKKDGWPYNLYEPVNNYL